jgi:hypothetical protein
MEIFRRTLYGGGAQVAQLLQIPLPILVNSTLNERLGIQQAATLGPTERPALRYFTLGIGGHGATTGVGNLPLIQSLQHSSSHSGHYRQLPFVMRTVGNDITAIERERYALRRIETIGGVDYIVYYARRIDTSGAQIKFQRRTVVGSVTTVEDFVPSAADLNPDPPDLSNGGVNTTDGVFLIASCKLEIVLDSFDITEILNAAIILYNSEDYAFVSEIGLVTGVDRMVPTNDGAGGSFSFNEAVCAQIFTHVNAMQPLKSQRDGLTLTYDVGTNEPLFALQP